MDKYKSIINVVKKQLKDFGEDIQFSHNIDTASYFKCKGLVTFSRQKYQNEEAKICISDMYKFITLEKPKILEFIYWKGGVYQVTSIDNSVKGIYKNICEYVQEYNFYELYITPSDSGDLKINHTLNLDLTLKHDEEVISNLTEYEFVWSSSNTKVAIVDNGIVTGVGEGSTNIIVYMKDNTNVFATYTITVKKDNIVLALIGDHKITETYKEYNYVMSDGRTNVTYEVTSNDFTEINKNFLINTNDGLMIKPWLSGLEGKLKIVVKSKATNKVLLIDTIDVDINEYSFSIINGDKMNLNIGDTFKISTEFKKNGKVSSKYNVTYTSSDSDIAMIDENGLIKALNKGTVVITATEITKNLKDTIKIDIIEKRNPQIDDEDYDDGSGILGVGKIVEDGTYKFELKAESTIPVQLFMKQNLNTAFTYKEMTTKFDKSNNALGVRILYLTLNTVQSHNGSIVIYGRDKNKENIYQKTINIEIDK